MKSFVTILTDPSSHSLSEAQLRQSAIRLLAFAYRRLFPGAMVSTYECTDVDFSLTFLVEEAPEETLLPDIERALLELVKADLPVDTLEMTAGNAADYLRSKGEELLAEELEELDGKKIVTLMKVDDAIFPCPEPFIQSTGEAKAVRLLEMISDRDLVSLTGMVGKDSKSLKKAVKRRETGEKRSHQNLVEEMGFATSHELQEGENWILLPRSLDFVNAVKLWWKGMQEARGIIEVTSGGANPVDQHARFHVGNDGLAEWVTLTDNREGSMDGLLDWPTGQGGLVTRPVPDLELVEQIEQSLLLFRAALSHFGLEYDLVFEPVVLTPHNQKISWKPAAAALKKAARGIDWKLEDALMENAGSDVGPRLTVRAFDARGYGWPLMRLAVARHPNRDEWLLLEQLPLSCSRLLALLLEQHGRILPTFLQPTHVVLLADEEESGFMQSVSATLEGLGLRVDCRLLEGDGTEQIRFHEKLGIPYTVVLENRELFSVWQTNSKRAVEMTIEALITQLLQEVRNSLGVNKVL